MDSVGLSEGMCKRHREDMVRRLDRITLSNCTFSGPVVLLREVAVLVVCKYVEVGGTCQNDVHVNTRI